MKTRSARQLAGLALAIGAGAALAQTSPGVPLGTPCGTTTNQQALGSSTLGSNVPGSSAYVAPSAGSVAGTNSADTTNGATSSAMAGPTTPGSTSSTPSTGTTAMGGPPATSMGSSSTLGSSSGTTVAQGGASTSDAATGAANTMGCH